MLRTFPRLRKGEELLFWILYKIMGVKCVLKMSKIVENVRAGGKVASCQIMLKWLKMFQH